MWKIRGSFSHGRGILGGVAEWQVLQNKHACPISDGIQMKTQKGQEILKEIKERQQDKKKEEYGKQAFIQILLHL